MSGDRSDQFIKLFCEELREIRKELRYSQEDVRKETGVTKAYLSQVENGKREQVSLSLVYQLSEYYQVPIEDIITRVRKKLKKTD
ncbi:helix-turn-helix domain-containing protein [Mammaliicoccus sciuri]|uniref:helix-turn-helix domain-containing protein n=1 Tax=Mammaliicoccus sciuri TaxID=1296 RepID=UPI003F548DA2